MLGITRSQHGSITKVAVIQSDTYIFNYTSESGVESADGAWDSNPLASK